MSMTNQQYLLIKLAEEANEIAQRALKCAQFGMNSEYQGKTNAEILSGELNDLHGVLDLLRKEGGYDYQVDPDALARKINKVNHYRECSRIEGCVQPA